ncbi:MAG: hypothetical protein WC541_00555 [Dehalococcoidia bacterium]
MPEGSYGWIQECGEVLVRVNGQTQTAYADFRPNTAKQKKELLKDSGQQVEELSSSTSDVDPLDQAMLRRFSLLPPLLIEDGPYCRLIREARDVFINGHFYACVAMCGISFERFQRDKATPYGAIPEHKMWKVRTILEDNKVLSAESLCLCKKMANLRNDYAHGHGMHPNEDALKSLEWMHSFINNETSLMRDYFIVNGILHRKYV